MSLDATELPENEIYVAAVITTLETARAAIARLGKAAPIGTLRGLDIALARLDQPGTTMARVAGDLRFRARNLLPGDWYHRQCAHALTFAAALIDSFFEVE